MRGGPDDPSATYNSIMSGHDWGPKDPTPLMPRAFLATFDTILALTWEQKDILYPRNSIHAASRSVVLPGGDAGGHIDEGLWGICILVSACMLPHTYAESAGSNLH